MTTLAVVEHLNEFEHRRGELDASLPALAVEQLDLHSAPEDSIMALMPLYVKN